MKTMERFFFPENERLCLQNDIDRLFSSGKSFVSYPLRIIYLPVTRSDDSESGISILVSVPKKRIKRAVKRNQIKRLIRESFRLNKHAFSDYFKQKGEHLHLAFIYICNDVKPYPVMEKAVQKALAMTMIG